MKKYLSLLILTTVSILNAYSQEVEMADSLRSDGKIYVVVLVLSIIMAGLFGYLFYLDKKVSQKENSNSTK